MRLFQIYKRKIKKFISIHTSQTGCDWDGTSDITAATDFNPHIPDGMRHKFKKMRKDSSDFNPHIPDGMRPKTKSFACVIRYFNPHIPDGMRLATFQSVRTFLLFQSTHPRRDATQNPPKRLLRGDNFNPHIPDGIRRAGSGQQRYKNANFNPHIPDGMRLTKPSRIERNRKIFQSTHPRRDATTARLENVPEENPISIHTSQTGCDLKAAGADPDLNIISIHTSQTGCDIQSRAQTRNDRKISIHTSQTGCDYRDRHPYKGKSKISIHTSQTGCDPAPLRGRSHQHDFNPHIPDGMRRPRTCADQK